MHFDARFAPAWTIVAKQIAPAPFRVAELARLRGIERAVLNRPVAVSKRRHRIVIGIAASEFVGSATFHMQFQSSLAGFSDDDGIFRQSYIRAAFLFALGQKYAVPLRAAGRDVIHVKNQVRKALIENAGLHLKRDLRGD
jgi:hypothetical protein